MLDTLEIERYIIEPSKNILTLFNHLGRYYYASKKININKSDTVLDISCGQGYGTYYLSQISKYAYGIDINENHINKAKELFKSGNLSYFVDKLLYVDKIVCLETIEHMEKDKIPEFLNNLFSYLKPEGKIFISFPIGNNAKSEYNKYHLCEPDINFIFQILKDKMKNINYEISKYRNDYNQECHYCYVWGN
jgi:cyclopropane fatty-acyl-phospholipid synthase-like methyltransferase